MDAISTVSTTIWKRLCLKSTHTRCYNPALFKEVLDVVPFNVLMAVENKQNKISLEQLETIVIAAGRAKHAIIESPDFSEIQRASKRGDRSPNTAYVR